MEHNIDLIYCALTVGCFSAISQSAITHATTSNRSSSLKHHHHELTKGLNFETGIKRWNIKKSRYSTEYNIIIIEELNYKLCTTHKPKVNSNFEDLIRFSTS